MLHPLFILIYLSITKQWNFDWLLIFVNQMEQYILKSVCEIVISWHFRHCHWERLRCQDYDNNSIFSFKINQAKIINLHLYPCTRNKPCVCLPLHERFLSLVLLFLVL